MIMAMMNKCSLRCAILLAPLVLLLIFDPVRGDEDNAEELRVFTTDEIAEYDGSDVSGIAAFDKSLFKLYPPLHLSPFPSQALSPPPSFHPSHPNCNSPIH